MTEEEEKIIRQVKTMLENATPFDMPPSRYNALKTMVNLIEKQQKEIERFNNELDLDYVDNNFVSKDKIREYLEKRINDVKKAYDDLTEPYYIEGVGFNISYMTKKEKEEFINKRNCLIVQKQAYKEILDKVEEKYEK